jgi:signal transduction histidine kinase
VTRGLGLASAAAASLVGASLIVRLANPFGSPPPATSDLVPHLWGIGALLILVLTRSWAPTVAWSAGIVGATASALGAVGQVREVRATNGDGSEPVLDAFVVLALVVPAVVAAAYATADGQRPRAVLAATWGTVLVLAGVLLANLVRRTLGMDAGGLPEWLWLFTVAVLATMGFARDLGPALARTRVRLAAGEARGDRTGGALTAMRVFVDELVPGREAGRAEAAESERGRLAADLHAEVLPSLRRALSEAEAGGTVERLAADLRSAVDEVESLLVARRSIVLEEIGLLAGVEWLAERVEERSTVRIEIEVTGDPADDVAGAGSLPGAGDDAPASPPRPPREVERAAFRVAQLALDNVVRHAPGARARVSVGVAPRAVRLTVEDDGGGPPVDEAAAARAGRRGLADMRAEARACGATLEVGRGAGGRGTAIRFRWPA